MSLFIDKHNRRKSPIALAAFGAALLDLVVFGGLYALLSEPLYRAVSLGSETATTVVHALLIALAGTAVCCLLFFLPDKRVAPYGFAGLAVVLAMFYVAAAAMSAPARGNMMHLITLFGLAPVLVGNAAVWPLYLKIRRAHPASAHRKTIQEELRDAAARQAAKTPAPKPAVPPTPAPETVSPEEALFGPEASGAGPGACRSAQEEAMLLFTDDEENDD